VVLSIVMWGFFKTFFEVVRKRGKKREKGGGGGGGEYALCEPPKAERERIRRICPTFVLSRTSNHVH